MSKFSLHKRRETRDCETQESELVLHPESKEIAV